MKARTRTTRRRFLKQSAALAVAAAGGVPLGVPNLLTAGAPNAKLGIAVIGCGGQGSGNPGLAASERLVAMVDVDEKRLGEAVQKIASKVPSPKTYYDYRRMFDECHKDIDAVLIATPDHHHAPAAIRAIQLGKHVFVEKPLTWCVYEARKLTESARKFKVATQMGNQGHSGEGYRRLCEYIWAGAIGNVVETHSLMSRSFGGSGGRPAGKMVPAGLHWDEWLGPAQPREYHDGLHPFNWRSWCEFGTGTLGDMGCHVLDGVFWALRLAEVKKFTIECLAQKGGSKEMFPQNNHLVWEFPARGDMPPVKVHSYDHAWPPLMQELEKKYGEKFGGGTLYLGDKGAMFTDTYGGNPHLLPKERHSAFPKPEAKIPRSKHGVKGDLLAACRGGELPSSNFDVSGPFTEFVLTGVLASRAGVGKKLDWDVESLRCTNFAEVNQWVKRDYRKGWEV
jgi:predicted dehydrogenase